MAKTKALARTPSATDPRHLLRYLKFQGAGADEEAMRQIAREEGVSLATVKSSVLQIDSYRKRNTTVEMDLAMRELVISSIPQAKVTLEGLLNATELVEQVNAKTGKKKVISVADKTTRLEALKTFNSIMQTLQPKTPAVEVNVSQTNQTANISGAESTEERFARLRKKAETHNLLPPETAAVPEYLDAGDDAPDDDDDEGDDEEGDDE